MNHREQILNAQIDQAAADNRLRDAAPELLDALKRITGKFRDEINWDDYELARLAIAKAEGDKP